MSFEKTITCGNCGESGTYRGTIFKELGPLFKQCPCCGVNIDFRRHCVEWCLLGVFGRMLIVFHASLTYVVYSMSFALLLTAAGHYVISLFRTSWWQEINRCDWKQVLLIPYLVCLLLCLLIMAWLVSSHIRSAIERSNARLAEPHYRKVLKNMGVRLPKNFGG